VKPSDKDGNAEARPIGEEPLSSTPTQAAAVQDSSAIPEVAQVKAPDAPLRPRPENLGISYSMHRDPRVFKGEKDLVDSLSSGFSFGLGDKPAKPIRSIDLVRTVKASPDEFIVQASDFAKGHAEALHEASIHPETREPIAGGMVVFGSGRGSYSMEKTIYSSVEAAAKLGVPIATGGAGGFMETANRAATVAGAFSSGIPIGGRNSLRSEKRTMSHLHDVTVMTSGYETRIPALLHRREIIAVAPGGMGTMKEVAVMMVAQAALPSVASNVVFIEDNYYGGLVDWLKQSNLPVAYKSRIGLVGDSAHMTNLVNSILEQEPGRKDNLIAPRKAPKNVPSAKPAKPTEPITPMGGGRDWFSRGSGDEGFGF
jgi:predicted Rossmann-fold nucleotide-binding protein